MKSSLLYSFLFGATAVTAIPHTSSNTNLRPRADPTYPNVNTTSLTYSGTGCTDSNLAFEIDSNGLLLATFYNIFSTADLTNAGAQITNTCQITTRIAYPAGWQFSIASTELCDPYYYRQLESFAITYGFSLSINGVSGSVEGTAPANCLATCPDGSEGSNCLQQFEVKPAPVVWSPCTGSATISITEVATATRTAPNKPNSTFGVPFWQWMHLNWRQC